MSVRCMSRVWEYSQQKGSALLLLLAIADNSKDNGVAWPGIEYLASKTRVSQRTVMRLIKTIEESGELLVSRELKYNRYYINVWPPRGPDVRCNRCGIPEAQELGIEMHRHHIIPKSKGGSDEDENIEILCVECHRDHHSFGSSDKLSPKGNGDIPDVLRDIYVTTGDISGSSSDIAKAPKPLINHHKESSNEILLKELLSSWKELFPNKPQPRESSTWAKTKVNARSKDKHFLDIWRDAMYRASQSTACQIEEWFHLEFFLRNDQNYQKCYDRWMAWKDREYKKSGRTFSDSNSEEARSRYATQLEDYGID